MIQAKLSLPYGQVNSDFGGHFLLQIGVEAYVIQSKYRIDILLSCSHPPMSESELKSLLCTWFKVNTPKTCRRHSD